MPIFEYTTVDASGAEVLETIEAHELTLLDHLSSVNVSDIAFFFRQLSSLLNSGVTLVNALFVLEEQEKKRRFQKMIGRIRLDTQGGASFLNALGRYPKTFDARVLGMVDAGEASGNLGLMLDRIATHLEEDAAFRSQLITGAIYPCVVIVVVIGVVGFLVGFVIPKIAPLLELKSQKLPWNTQLIIDVSEWFKLYWKQLSVILGFTVSVLILAYRFIPGVVYWSDRIKIKLPLIGPVFFYSAVVQFTRNLSTLVGSGVSVLESLRIVRGIIRNQAVKRVLKTMEAHILKGDNLSAPIKAAPHIFPPMVASMVAVGEETGSVDQSLGIAADIHEKILNTYIARMTAMIEPLLIIVLGGVVGFVAFAMISGILTMYQV